MIALRPSEVSLVVRGNPLSQNRAWRIITFKPKNGGAPHASMKLSSEGAVFKAEIASAVAMRRPREWDRENEYEVTCVYYFDSRRPDCDGPGKLVLDALGDFVLVAGNKALRFQGLYRNDRQVWRFTQQRELDQANPRAEITVRLRHAPTPRQEALIR